VWGDFSVTFLFWWAAGSVVTVLANDAVWRSRKDSKDGSASSEQRDGGD
jgi:hypothetical protein